MKFICTRTGVSPCTSEFHTNLSSRSLGNEVYRCLLTARQYYSLFGIAKAVIVVDMSQSLIFEKMTASFSNR